MKHIEKYSSWSGWIW